MAPEKKFLESNEVVPGGRGHWGLVETCSLLCGHLLYRLLAPPTKMPVMITPHFQQRSHSALCVSIKQQ